MYCVSSPARSKYGTNREKRRLFKIDHIAGKCWRQPSRLIAKNDAQQRTVDLEVPVVIDKAELSKFVHEKAHARPGRPNHFGKRLLADFCGDKLRPAPPCQNSPAAE